MKMAPEPTPIEIFFCYAHEDKPFRNKLDAHLKVLKDSGFIRCWYDEEIAPGDLWEAQIKDHLNKAQIILLLVSVSFLNSPKNYEDIMPLALERHKKGTALAIPVLLKSVYLGGSPLSILQMLPTDARPITGWRDRDAAFADVAKNIHREVMTLQNQISSTVGNPGKSSDPVQRSGADRTDDSTQASGLSLTNRQPVQPLFSQVQRPGELVQLLASFLGIIGFAWLDIYEVSSMQLPTTLNFYVLAVWAFVAAFLGGLIWNVLNYAHPTLEGRFEHGISAVLWPITTNVPVVCALIILNWLYHFTSIPYQFLISGPFLIGITIGSVIFYNVPFPGKKRGFREYIESASRSYLFQEFWLAVLWSFLISCLGFLATILTKYIVIRTGDFLTPLLQIVCCVGLTTSAVVLFILVFPDKPEFVSARGIIAGLVLRMTFFFGFFLVTGPVHIQF
jgi:hypothetical protein